jgi:hypothetical protein
VDNGGGIYIVCPDDHGSCDGHSHGPAPLPKRLQATPPRPEISPRSPTPPTRPFLLTPSPVPPCRTCPSTRATMQSK